MTNNKDTTTILMEKLLFIEKDLKINKKSILLKRSDYYLLLNSYSSEITKEKKISEVTLRAFINKMIDWGIIYHENKYILIDKIKLFEKLYYYSEEFKYAIHIMYWLYCDQAFIDLPSKEVKEIIKIQRPTMRDNNLSQKERKRLNTLINL